MTTYIGGFPTLGGITAENLSTVELRVISNLLQQDKANNQQDNLSTLRNDQAFELGITPPVIPGQ